MTTKNGKSRDIDNIRYKTQINTTPITKKKNNMDPTKKPGVNPGAREG